jgi:hypothetical protein
MMHAERKSHLDALVDVWLIFCLFTTGACQIALEESFTRRRAALFLR